MNKRIHKFVLIALCLLATTNSVFAQESVTLSISPTLYDMSAEPGQTWQSNLRIVNVNPFDLTVYIDVVNFAPKGEGGDGRFIPLDEAERSGKTLAEWILISREAITIPREQTKEVPFTVRIPEGASPGGHFAALLVGTKPIRPETGQARLQTAQMVTSLFFARVAGDVVESGLIREFTTERTYLNTPEADFLLRFENKGNVHLQPRGEIKIYNMWGEERGVIPINQYSNFGNVLPTSIRKFTFTWKGEWSVSDIGRYTAVATLGYGTDEKKFASSETIFWVIPFKLLFGIAFGLILFFGCLTWLVRLYVRHMLIAAGIHIDEYHELSKKVSGTKRSLLPAAMNIKAPVTAGILDLTNRFEAAPSLSLRVKALTDFVVQYRLFFLGILLLLGFITLVSWYIMNANTKHRAYEVVYTQDESATAVTSEEILYDQLKAKQGLVDTQIGSTSLGVVNIINRSGTPGVGAEAALRLEQAGYTVQSLHADFSSQLKRTVILYAPESIELALVISAEFNQALISVGDDLADENHITVLIGSDITDQ